MGSREDDRVIHELSTPRVDQVIESLEYWLRRRARLPFYRRAARREADTMIAFWQSHAAAGLPRAPWAVLASRGPLMRIGRLALSYYAGRFLRRAALVALAAVVVTTAVVQLALSAR